MSLINPNDFWTKKKEGEIEITIHLLLKFIQSLGFRKIINDGSFQLVKITQKRIVSLTSKIELRDEINNHLCEIEEPWVFEKILKGNYLSTQLIESIQTIEVITNQGNSETGYLYFENGVIEIKKDSIRIIEYENFDYFIWKQQVIPSKYMQITHEGSEFQQFCFLVSGENESRYNLLISSIGYLLHSYKNQVRTKAIILTDEKLYGYSTDYYAQGGTGKSLLAKAIGFITPLLLKDAKIKNKDNRFYFANVKPYHKVIALDDVYKGFDFESLFSLITGDFTVEEKYVNPITIEFNKSAKVLITSNYYIGDNISHSEKRRKVEIELNPYFRKTSIQDHFGHILFEEWSEEEWEKFNSFMTFCLQYYLSNGIVELPESEIIKKKLIESTNLEFINFISQVFENPQHLGTPIDINLFKIDKKVLYDKFIEIRTEESLIEQKTFNQWIQLYSTTNKINIESKKSNGKYFWIIVQLEKKL